MTANAVRFAAGLALGAFAAPLPATAQYFPPVMHHRPAGDARLRGAEGSAEAAA